MAHRHDHDENHHYHHHDHDNAPEMSFPEKLEKLLNHWIRHNREHVETYRKWSDKALEQGMADISELIEEAAQTSRKVDIVLENALERLREKK